MPIHELAGKPTPLSLLTNIPRLVSTYYTHQPDPGDPAQLVSFGTSGHRGTSFDSTFNEDHILTICQAICELRQAEGINGPLFIGPIISHAILTHNDKHPTNRADGVVITPSHNPPKDGGFKYNPPSGGPADTTTKRIQNRANQIMRDGLKAVKVISFSQALKADTTRGAAIGGLKVVTDNGWFAVRPSGTEEIYKIYAESFKGADHFTKIQSETQAIVQAVFRTAGLQLG